MSNDPILHLLGLAKKAGRLEIGEESAGAACRARQAKLLLLAADAAPNTRRRASHFSEAGNVLWLDTPFDKAQLGFILGRSSCAMLALTDAGFSAAVAEKLALRDPERYGPAAEALRERAGRVLQRQKEQRRHEKNLRSGKRKPWVPPPPAEAKQVPSVRGRPKAVPDIDQAKAERRPKERLGRPPRPKNPSTKGGPSGRRLTGKFRHS